MVGVVFYQFGLGAIALLIRFGDRPARRCALSCASCVLKWVRCCCCCCCRQRQSSTGGEVVGRHRRCGRAAALLALLLWPVAWVLSRLKLRWYWFHLAAQVGLHCREFALISLMDGWRWQVAIAHGAIWLALVFVGWECWRFSKVRVSGRAADAIDQVLDMLLLPVNFGFVCALCVRILTLQRGHQNHGMVSAIIGSADIWEAWALWSVLELFVRVVEVTSSRDPKREHDAEYHQFIQAFKALSLQGVKAWVFILSCTVAFNVLMKGIVAVLAPTLCFRVSHECISCEEWYHRKVSLAAESVLFILCSFALVFVFTFERVFAEYLHSIQPFWKFWGVKSVVSVTYFQWLILSYCTGFGSDQVYQIHSLLCAVEMPLLSILHATCAYPYGKPWMDVLLSTAPGAKVRLPKGSAARLKAVEMRATDHHPPAAAASPPATGGAAAGPAAALAGCPLPGTSFSAEEEEGEGPAAAAGARRGGEEDEDEEEAVGRDEPLAAAGRGLASVEDAWPLSERLEVGAGGEGAGLGAQATAPPAPPDDSHDDCASVCFYMLVAAACCYGSTRLMVWLAPLEDEINETEPLYELTCNSESVLETFVKEREERDGLHWVLPQQARAEFRRGLPLCSTAKLGCAVGFSGRPNVTCSAAGTYRVVGGCKASECGQPPQLPHASVNWEDAARQDWTMGMRVSYDCEKGFRGAPVAVCGKEAIGKYKVEGACLEVLCGWPPTVHNAEPLANATNESQQVAKWRLGTTVHYQCNPGFRGEPTALCSDEGLYVLSGRCKVDCGPPPPVEHAVPEFDSKLEVDPGFTEGVRIPYNCTIGHGGEVAAVCGQDGKWTVDGKCVTICGPPRGLSHARPLVPRGGRRHKWAVGARVSYVCDPGYSGEPLAECVDSGNWEFIADTGCTYMGCGPVDAHLSKAVGPSWQETMRPERALNVTPGGFEDVIVLSCARGLAGHPFAACLRGHWSLSGSCGLLPTSLGCRCKRRWVLCEDWRQTDCQVWYGCSSNSSRPYSWCEVEESSCPSSASGAFRRPPSWDYCADEGSSSGEWPREPAEGSARRTRTAVAVGGSLVVVAGAAAGIWQILRGPGSCRRWRWRRPSMRQLRPPEERASQTPLGFASDMDRPGLEPLAEEEADALQRR